MVVTAHRAVTRPPAEWALVLLLGFLGLTAAAGGFVMTTGIGGSQVRPPATGSTRFPSSPAGWCPAWC